MSLISGLVFGTGSFRRESVMNAVTDAISQISSVAEDSSAFTVMFYCNFMFPAVVGQFSDLQQLKKCSSKFEQ